MMFRDFIFYRLGGMLPPEEIRRWFEPLQWDYDGVSGHVRVTAPTIFHRRCLTEKYAAHMTALASSVQGWQVSRLTLESRENPATVTVLSSPRHGPDSSRAGTINVDHNFQNYIVTDSNRLPFWALSDFSDFKPNLGSRLIFLISPGPWGKTHLLNALTIKLAGEPSRQFIRISAANDFQVQLHDDQWRNLSLIIDDIHLLAGKTEAHQRLARFLDEMPSGFAGLVCSSPVSPQKLEGFSESLRSRLSGGLVLKIELPEYDLLKELAVRRARERGLEMTPEALSLLVRRCENDPRRLQGFIETVWFTARRGGLSADEIVSRFYPDTAPGKKEKQVDLENILAAVSAAFGLRVADLTGHSKLRQAAWPRRVGMYLAKEMTGLTTTKIGEAFGGRDHSTVIHALKKIHQELKNPAQAQLVENIKRSLIIGE